MSGVKRSRKPKVNKSVELVRELPLRRGFYKVVSDFRAEFGIPVRGFDWFEEQNAWREGLQQSSKAVRYHTALRELMKRYELPPTPAIESVLEMLLTLRPFNDLTLPKHIVTDGKPDLKATPSTELMMLRPPQMAEVQNVGRSYIDVRIFAGTSKEDALRFLRKNWQTITYRLWRRGPEQASRKIKTKLNVERDVLICELNSLSTETLLELAGDFVGDKNRATCISKIIAAHGYKRVTVDTINGVLRRHNDA